MTLKLSSILQDAGTCTCGNPHHAITLDKIVVEPGALRQVGPYLKERLFRNAAVVADAHTYEAAGRTVIDELKASGIACKLIMALPDHQGDVVADEATLLQVMLEIPHETTDVIIAVGSGTLHDIVRLNGYKMNKPFISIPTAPSVDGFTSMGAPVILRGEKKTIPASAPIAIFADLDVLAKAPKSLVAAGFGDMLGKYTSLFDWQIGRLTGDEPYCATAAAVTREALAACVDHVEEIAKREPSGIRILMNALIESGLAMLIMGTSHSASGAEHHLSHYWEMAYLKLGRKQLLHGAKVGVACSVISKLYHELIAEERLFQQTAETEEGRKVQESLRAHLDEIAQWLGFVPDPSKLQELLQTAGGPTTPAELGVDSELLARSLKEAQKVRLNRYTLLRAYNEMNG